MSERRGRGSGHVTHVRCRACDVPVLLDPNAMVLKEAHAELRCPACGAVVPVRRNDAYRRPPDGIWGIASYSHDEGRHPARRGLRTGRRA
ncbi:MAG TPA: hypothetical protein VFA84_00700 [Acidimicrobiales bacterium]|nr:hypothetical protein [Acidimicrobiales bacterium]